jgi:hypothetical protein
MRLEHHNHVLPYAPPSPGKPIREHSTQQRSRHTGNAECSTQYARISWDLGYGDEEVDDDIATTSDTSTSHALDCPADDEGSTVLRNTCNYYTSAPHRFQITDLR